MCSFYPETYLFKRIILFSDSCIRVERPAPVTPETNTDGMESLGGLQLEIDRSCSVALWAKIDRYIFIIDLITKTTMYSSLLLTELVSMYNYVCCNMDPSVKHIVTC